ncbi:hypothetical protein TVAG_126040 [Trichomonas vaginalis G3]|uniref:Uncharacterized protein n=1 Tax=Trichomonas vaginalis (strain ATCC PRA-98 / G3) TaxID=412133 RepID=A2ECZ2_TRIV3|nr:arginase protein [Trichomonas vaginalis G3]EAY09443.1 hypothetical protein TVAG_126040 [Trichomonas vaginalis G3]KAI5500661.1 arginase protein [Trichomonas vaginalis G3]|eukprot:XP_001321666.1 hypothetical protein [Trichomonas vaginalis G3]
MCEKLRLVFPQWQGGETNNIASYVTELEPKVAAQGYVIGSELLQWLAPVSSVPMEKVPVSLDDSPEAVATENGIFAYKIFSILKSQRKLSHLVVIAL